MANEEIKVNDNVYKVTINDQTRMYAMKLNRLYQQGFNDVDSFDEISSEISTTINNLLKNGLSPEVQEEDMDGAVKQLLHMFDKSKKWDYFPLWAIDLSPQHYLSWLHLML